MNTYIKLIEYLINNFDIPHQYHLKLMTCIKMMKPNTSYHINPLDIYFGKCKASFFNTIPLLCKYKSLSCNFIVYHTCIIAVIGGKLITCKFNGSLTSLQFNQLNLHTQPRDEIKTSRNIIRYKIAEQSQDITRDEVKTLQDIAEVKKNIIGYKMADQYINRNKISDKLIIITSGTRFDMIKRCLSIKCLIELLKVEICQFYIFNGWTLIHFHSAIKINITK